MYKSYPVTLDTLQTKVLLLNLVTVQAKMYHFPCCQHASFTHIKSRNHSIMIFSRAIQQEERVWLAIRDWHMYSVRQRSVPAA